ncbi:hypothetical protein [Klebsiella phage vB_KpS_KW1.2]
MLKPGQSDRVLSLHRQRTEEIQNESNLHTGKVKHDAWWFSG